MHLISGTIAKGPTRGEKGAIRIERGDKFTEAQIAAMKKDGTYYTLFGKHPSVVVVHEYKDAKLIEACWPQFMRDVNALIVDEAGGLRVSNGKVLGDPRVFAERVINALPRITACVPPPGSTFLLWRRTGKQDNNGLDTYFSLDGTGQNETFHNRLADFIGGQSIGPALGAALMLEGTAMYNLRRDESKHDAAPSACRDSWAAADVDAMLGHVGLLPGASGASPRKLTERRLCLPSSDEGMMVRPCEVISDAVHRDLLPTSTTRCLDVGGFRLDMPDDTRRCAPRPGALPGLLLAGSGGAVLPMASLDPPTPPAALQARKQPGKRRARADVVAPEISAFFGGSSTAPLHSAAAGAGSSADHAAIDDAAPPVCAANGGIAPAARQRRECEPWYCSRATLWLLCALRARGQPVTR